MMMNSVKSLGVGISVFKNLEMLAVKKFTKNYLKKLIKTFFTTLNEATQHCLRL